MYTWLDPSGSKFRRFFGLRRPDSYMSIRLTTPRTELEASSSTSVAKIGFYQKSQRVVVFYPKGSCAQHFNQATPRASAFSWAVSTTVCHATWTPSVPGWWASPPSAFVWSVFSSVRLRLIASCRAAPGSPLALTGICPSRYCYAAARMLSVVLGAVVAPSCQLCAGRCHGSSAPSSS